WYAILSKYTPGFVQLCQWAEENSTELAERFLKENMFNDVPFPEQEAVVSAIVDRLTDLSKNKSHDKHIHIDDCLSMGLRIVRLEDSKNKALQDLVLSVHHCFMYALANTPAFKIMENHTGGRFMKFQQSSPNFQFVIPPAKLMS